MIFDGENFKSICKPFDFATTGIGLTGRAHYDIASCDGSKTIPERLEQLKDIGTGERSSSSRSG
ncbi:MAG TPA: hypothetical protein VN154_01095 [Rhizomicrobium sp.]|nr:hypothetical protein [Rhizomicrobium sp.]